MGPAIAVMAVASLAQLYNAEKARGAAKDRLNEIEGLYKDIKPPNYDLKIDDPPQLHEEMLKQPQFSSAVASPNFNLEKLTPEQFKSVGKFIPQLAPYVQQAAPQTLKQTGDMKAGRDAQLAALKRFQSIGAGEFDPQYQEAVTRAGRAAQQEAQSREASILQDFARRGQSGSGLSLAAQLQGASTAMDRNAQTNLSAASQAYQNRLNALSQGASLGSQIQNQDTDFQSRNAGIINDFNNRVATARQGWEQQRAGAMNEAQRYNIGVDQNLANMNVQNRNQAMQADQARQDTLAKYGYDVARNAQQRNDELAKWGYNAAGQERAYQNQVATTKAAWAADERAKQNNLLSSIFNNQMASAGARAGVGQSQINNIVGTAQDRNAAIQGLSNIASTYASGQQAQQNDLQSNMANDDRVFFQKYGRWPTTEERAERRQAYTGGSD